MPQQHTYADDHGIRTVQGLRGHKHIQTTIATHVLNRGGRGVRRPAGRMSAKRKGPSTQERT